jgi:hypothetical protein
MSESKIYLNFKHYSVNNKTGITDKNENQAVHKNYNDATHH